MSYVTLCGSWDFAEFGACTYTLTDSAGAHAPFTFSSGTYEPHDLIVRAGVLSPGLNSFATAFRNALNAASPTKTYSVEWDQGTGRYKIGVNSGTFSIVASGGSSRVDPYNLLGNIGAIVSTGDSWTSILLPWFVIKPSRPGLTAYVQPLAAADSIKKRVSAGGTAYHMAPSMVPRMASWRHQFEPKYMVDRDAFGATGETLTHFYTWEDLWQDFRLAKMPIGIEVGSDAGSYENLAFALDNPDYDDTTVKRRAPNDDGRFTISIRARLWLGNTRSGFARTFNA